MVATLTTTTQLFKRQAHKMVKHSQTSRRIGLLIFINETLRDLVLFIQFKNMKNAPWRKITFSKVALRVFLTFFKLYKWYQIAWYHKYFRGTTKISISFLIIEAIESTVVAN